MKVVTGECMRDLDRQAIGEHGVPGLTLMENAGAGAAREILRWLPGLREGGRVLVLAGRGNNGGDGFVVARHFREQGIGVEVILFGKRGEVKGDARVNLERWETMNGPVPEILAPEDFKIWIPRFDSFDLFIDALFGTGLNQEVRGLPAEAIRAVNEVDVPRAAIDIPSGLHSSTGEILGEAFRADFTATFGLPKLGMVLYPGAEMVGTMTVVDIGLPPAVIQGIKNPYILLDRTELLPLLPPRPPESHKGNYGHLLIIAGSLGKTGAAVLAALGALKIGTGLVSVALPRSLNSIILANLPEAMTEPLPETEDGVLRLESVERILRALEGKTAIVIGPGISTLPHVGEIVAAVIKKAEVPVLVDADALTHIARDRNVIAGRACPVVLTPHPGELARVLNTTSAEVQKNRIASALAASRGLDAWVVLKGARTVIAGPQGEILVNPTGNPGMAQGGMGDVLSGIIGGLLAQGLSPGSAAALGVFLHGMAADAIRFFRSEVGILASEVAEGIPFCVEELRTDDSGEE